MKRDIEFSSKGSTVRGWLITPDSGSGPFPVVVMAGGWCYVKEVVMPHYADYFVSQGIATLLFDYRGLGASDGKPRQHLDPWGQIEDYRNAITFVQTQAELDPDRIGIWGISYSGGHALILSAIEPRIKCAVSNIPVVDGYQNMRRVQGERLFGRLLELVRADRETRYRTGEGGAIPMSSRTPETEASTWPFPDVFEIFSNIKQREAPAHEHWSTIESVELLMQYTVFPYLRRILSVPVMMVVAEGDEKTLWDLEIDAFNQIAASNKRLVLLPAVSHMSLYSTRSHLELAATAAGDFLRQHLVGAVERTAVAH
ncbi:MAG TPA: alpha/beta fold hydrolase [Candidatus Nitrosotalea sp.]|jgi:pimeloyl-ACP methyl ester carboxylesterase|nr:alpha/beta fold hydrolase [Candidatus Nitrosotalea sp.]